MLHGLKREVKWIILTVTTDGVCSFYFVQGFYTCLKFKLESCIGFKAEVQ